MNKNRYARLTDQLLFKTKFPKSGSEPNENISAFWGEVCPVNFGRLYSETLLARRNFLLLDSFPNDLVIGLAPNRHHFIF